MKVTEDKSNGTEISENLGIPREVVFFPRFSGKSFSIRHRIFPEIETEIKTRILNRKAGACDFVKISRQHWPENRKYSCNSHESKLPF